MYKRAIRALAILTGAVGLLAAQTAPTKQIDRFKDEVTKSGYKQQEAAVGVYDFDAVYCSGRIWTADWPNPNSPYISAEMPPVPGQPVPNAALNEFRIREDEALVAIGMTPPPVAYFSLNLHMLRGSLNTVPPLLWIPVGDPINNGVIQTTGPTPFNQPFVAVFTGNRQTQADVHKMLRNAGLQAAINDQAIPPALFNLGLQASADEYAFAMRSAVAENQQVFDNYIAAFKNTDTAQRPIRMFRVRPLNSSGNDQIQPVFAPDPLPVTPLRVAGTGTTELDLYPTLQLLRQRIIDAYPGYTATDYQNTPARTDLRVDPAFEEPYPGLQRNMVLDPPKQDGVAGATSDATYLASGNFSLPDGAFLVAYGAHHRATGKATYSSVSVYADPVGTVGLTTVQSPKLQGSARDYINDQRNADMFYAWTFTRGSSSGSHVSQLISKDYCQSIDPSLTRPVDLNTLRIIYRAYMEPATKIHPAKSEMLLDRLLMFTPK